MEQATAYGTVIVVDDSSPDDTAAVAAAAGAVVISNKVNCGYDAPLSRGFKEAERLGFTHAVTMDADGEHDPRLLARFRQLLLTERIPLVLGVRPRKQRVAEIIMGLYIHATFGVRDILCGIKGYDPGLHRANGGFDGRRRLDGARFDRRWRANLRILRALLRIVGQDLRIRRSRLAGEGSRRWPPRSYSKPG